jgi:hypothetical protein
MDVHSSTVASYSEYFLKLFRIRMRNEARKKKRNPRIIEHPEKALKIDVECILENKRLGIGSAFCEFSWGRRVGEFVAEECRLADKKVTMYSK